MTGTRGPCSDGLALPPEPAHRQPRLACILLWYPLFTQPFIFRELEALKAHLPLTIHSLYGRNLRCCSAAMKAVAPSVQCLGLRAMPRILASVSGLALRQPRRFWRLFRRCLCRRWPSWEILGENLWAFLAGIHLAGLFRQRGVEVSYAPWPRGTATAAWVVSELTGIPFVLTVRGDNLAPADPDLPDKLRAACRIRANNAADTQRISTLAPDVAHKVELVYNSLTLPDLPARAAVADAPNRDAPARLLALGRFDVTKGFDVLLRACALLRQRGLRFSLTLAGGGGLLMGLGPLEKDLLALRASLGLEELVSLPGLISHDALPQLMAGHDIFVAPCVMDAAGRRDGIPNTVIEALSQGLPVVASRLNALPEVVLHGETGLLTPPGEPGPLADAIQWLAERPEEARRMGAAGARLARAMFNPATNSQRLAGLLASCRRGDIPCRVQGEAPTEGEPPCAA